MAQVLYHYTDELGLAGILASGLRHASTAARNPRDVRYGDGKYLSDVVPGTLTPAQLSRRFLGQPFQGHRFTHLIAIDVEGLNPVEGRPGVFVIPGDQPLDLDGRIVRHGEAGSTTGEPGG